MTTRSRLKTTVARRLAKHLCRFYKKSREICYGCIQAERDIEEKLCMMFNDETVSNCKPFLPKRWDSLFDNEAGSDVVFLVGAEPDIWRFPGHRSILRNNPVFRAMLEGPFANAESKIVIQDVDGRAFDHLLRYLYREDVHFQSVGTALTTLYAANKYLCPELVAVCVRYLDAHITTETVLQIYQHLRFYSNDLNSEVDGDPSGLPSAPPKRDVEDEPLLRNDNEDCGKHIFHSCTALLFNCYHFIDSHADEVFNEESVEDLTKDALYDLAKRDTLGVSSESILFNVVEKWCNRECKRCQVELSNENRKTILGDRLLFSVRYLLMTSEEFLAGPMHSGLFDQTETAIILGHILNHTVTIASERITPQVLTFLRRPRNRNKLHSVIPLSTRTERKVTKYDAKCVVSSRSASKKEKKRNKEKKDVGESKCLNYTLNVLASIFD